MKIWTLLTDKLALKFLSLLFAAVLWLFVALEKVDELDLTVPVTIARVPAGLAVKEPVRPLVNVRLSGATILLMRQQQKQPTLVLDLSGVTVGKVSFAGLDHLLELVPGVRVSRIQPASLDVLIVKQKNSTALRETQP